MPFILLLNSVWSSLSKKNMPDKMAIKNHGVIFMHSIAVEEQQSERWFQKYVALNNSFGSMQVVITSFSAIFCNHLSVTFAVICWILRMRILRRITSTIIDYDLRPVRSVNIEIFIILNKHPFKLELSNFYCNGS